MGTPTPRPPIIGVPCSYWLGNWDPSDYTPRFLLFDIANIEKCPYALCDPPDGHHILTQQLGSPCIWFYADMCCTIIFQIWSTYCSVLIYYWIPYHIFFNSWRMALGTTDFVNTIDYCDGAVNFGRWGTAEYIP